MITLQSLLESDSLSTIVAKLNNNFQAISLAGGGPQGTRGDQGIPGLPGRIGPTGAMGPQGPTGISTYMIPFADGPSGTTGPSSISGPWPVASLDYLDTTVGTGQNGDIYVDHYNKGYWMFLSAADATGQYSNVGPSYPPDGSGYFGGTGWYFYPQEADDTASEVWTYDYTTYFTKPPYATGPFNALATELKVPNARFNSKYGTVWISSGNSGGSDNTNYQAPSIYDWGYDYGDSALSFPQPGRWNSGVDRLLFKFSLDALPYHSAVNARSAAALGVAVNSEENSFPQIDPTYPIFGDDYWVKPYYDAPLDQYTPLFFWSEIRPEVGVGDTRFSSMALYQFTAIDASPYGSIGGGVTAGSTASTIFSNDKKSVFLLSTRLAPSPEDFTLMGTTQVLNNSRTINISELLLDFKNVTISNQVVVGLPQDLRLSSDYVDPGDDTYREAAGNYPFRVFQGFISAANGKNTAGDVGIINYIDYGAGVGSPADPNTPTLGNQTRRSWFGSGFRFDDVSNWSTGSSDPLAEGYVRLAGMSERGKKTWNISNDDTFFLSELIFYTSQFNLGGTAAGTGHNASSQTSGFDGELNSQNSLPAFYVSPFRSLGIGTFAKDDLGVWEPQARLHVHTNSSVFDSFNDPAGILTSFTGTISTDPLIINDYAVKAAVFTASDPSGSNNQGFIDLFLGKKEEPDYEDANPYDGGLSPITSVLGNNYRIAFRREGWYANQDFDSLRFGVLPAATGSDIGQDLTTYRNEFQLGIHPLNVNATDASDPLSAIAGVGVHNIWPRARFHVFGKNRYNEADRGEETAYPGYSYAEQGYGPSGTLPFYNPNYRSNNQIVADYIGDSYLYPSGILEYEYRTVLGAAPLTGTSVSNTGTFSTNSANYPFREIQSPTRHMVPYGTTGDSGALYGPFWNDDFTGVTASTGAFNNSFRHGGITGASYKPTHYIGFNIFRDLMNVGDDKDAANTWVLGTNGGVENGGSLILTNSEGDFAISNIAAQRSGGEPYAYWEQKISTRDVLDNIKFIVKKDGSVGFGNAAGYDQNAYSSVERDLDTGYLNYRPSTLATAVGAGPYTAGAGLNYNISAYSQVNSSNLSYGLVRYGGTATETSSGSTASRVNSQSTIADTFRADFAADKLFGRPGRTIAKGGWGYPSNRTISISGATAIRYLSFTGSYAVSGTTHNLTTLSITTDFEGRINSLDLFFAPAPPSGFTGGSPLNNLVQAILIPHPTEFNTGGPLNGNIASATWSAPPGAAAAEWDGENSTWNGNVGAGFGKSIDFAQDPLILANVRLNNFVAGEGLGYSGGSTASADAATVKTARQQSPKLVFTFMESDNTPIPGSSTGTRLDTGTAGYRKVNTVVASAQNESSLREYWIPRSDNSGGTFMVFTDHYGQKEKNSGFDKDTIDIDNLFVESVVTLEFIYGYTGAAGRGITSSAANSAHSYGASGTFGGTAYWPAHVLYKNKAMLDSVWPTYGYTGPLKADTYPLFDDDEYAKIYSLGPTAGLTGAIWPDDTDFNSDYFNASGTGSTLVRNVEKFYEIYNPATNYDNGWNSPDITNKASEIRFKRINSDFAMLDFNLTLSVRNPNLDTNVAPGEGTTANWQADDQSKLIDRGSPRFTQFVRFKYFPSANDPDHYEENEFLRNLFGNGLAFSNWSSFQNWYPGTALVGSGTGMSIDGLTGSLSTTNTGEPAYYVNNTGTVFDRNVVPKWTGNLINYGIAQQYEGGVVPDKVLEAKRSGQASGTSAGEDYAVFSWVDARKNMNWPMYNRAALMFQTFAASGDQRQAYFSTYLGSMFQLMGNRGFSRVRNCVWRIVPQFGNFHNPGVGFPPTEEPLNTFVIEVMFDDPILHVDTPLAALAFATGIKGFSNSDVSHFKYLTLNGQAFVRYTNTGEWLAD